MIAEDLLSAAMGTGLQLLVETGFADEVGDIETILAEEDAQVRRQAFDAAVKTAREAVADEIIRQLLGSRSFQEEVAKALLDPVGGFDVQALSETLGKRFLPEQARGLRRFFSALENTLLADDIWGHLLELYQNLRSRIDIQQKLESQGLNVPGRELVNMVSAHLYGSGAIAQGGAAKALGEGSLLVEDSNIGRIIQVTVKQLVVKHVPATETRKLRRLYLLEVSNEVNLLPWGSISTQFADPVEGEDLRLADMYIDLDTTQLRNVEHEEELRQFLAQVDEVDRIPAQEVVNNEPRVLMMGDPGSGKSSFIKHLAHQLTQASLAANPDSWLARLGHWDHGALLPIWVELRQMAAFGAETGSKGEARLLLNYLHQFLEKWELGAFWPELNQTLRQEQKPALLLLDGLDEVSTDQRQLIVDVVNDFCQRYEQHRYVVTCRPYAYVGQPWQLQNFHEVTLAPFSEEQIKCFVENWYQLLAQRGRISRQQELARAESLKQTARRRDLYDLAKRPLLLTVMAQLHAFFGKLQDDRTDLYADAVQLLLQRWEARLGEPGILERLKVPNLKMADLEAGLYKVAFCAHQTSEHGQDADIREGELRERLAPYLGGSWDKAGEFVGYIRERAGLLIRHKTDAYTFPHRSFQEFLAGCYLVAMDDYPGEAARFVQQDLDRWREVFVLAAGRAARTHRLGQAIGAVNAILPADIEQMDKSEHMDWQLAELAAEALLEMGLVGITREKAGNTLIQRTRAWLVGAIQTRTLSAGERAAAGRSLGKLGEPRLEVCTLGGMQFCSVPEGRFLMGSKPDVGKTSDDELPQHIVTLPTYFISRYPVTHMQYMEFVEAGGYKRAQYWKEAEKVGIWVDGLTRRRFVTIRNDVFKAVSEWGDTPKDFGPLYSSPNYPVLGVTWYEAIAFTSWITETWQAQGSLPEGWSARLPTEAEWEKAARGGLEIPVVPQIVAAGEGSRFHPNNGNVNKNSLPMRIYPWGDELDPDKANVDETNIDGPSTVGCFPAGESPYGVLEMSGNVWEWCSSLYKGYPYHSESHEDLNAPADVSRVMRGGSFNKPWGQATCTARRWGDPDVRNGNLGFRIVVSVSRDTHQPLQ